MPAPMSRQRLRPGTAIATSAQGGVIRTGVLGGTYRDPFGRNVNRSRGGGGGGGGSGEASSEPEMFESDLLQQSFSSIEAKEAAEAAFRSQQAANIAAEAAKQKQIFSRTLGGQTKKSTSAPSSQFPSRMPSIATTVSGIGGTLTTEYNQPFSSRLRESGKTLIRGPFSFIGEGINRGSGIPFIGGLGDYSSAIFAPFRQAGFSQRTTPTIFARRETIMSQPSFSGTTIIQPPDTPLGLVSSEGLSAGQYKVALGMRAGLPLDIVGVPAQAVPEILQRPIRKEEQERINRESLSLQTELQSQVNSGTLSIEEARNIYDTRSKDILSAAKERYSSRSSARISEFAPQLQAIDTQQALFISGRESGGKALQFLTENAVLGVASRFIKTPNALAREIDSLHLENLGKRKSLGFAIETQADPLLSGRQFAFAGLKKYGDSFSITSANIVQQQSGSFLARNIETTYQFRSFATGKITKGKIFSGGLQGVSSLSDNAARAVIKGVGMDIPGQAFTGTSVLSNVGRTRQPAQFFGGISKQIEGRRANEVITTILANTLRGKTFRTIDLLGLGRGRTAFQTTQLRGRVTGKTFVYNLEESLSLGKIVGGRRTISSGGKTLLSRQLGDSPTAAISLIEKQTFSNLQSISASSPGVTSRSSSALFSTTKNAQDSKSRSITVSLSSNVLKESTRETLTPKAVLINTTSGRAGNRLMFGGLQISSRSLLQGQAQFPRLFMGNSIGSALSPRLFTPVISMGALTFGKSIYLSSSPGTNRSLYGRFKPRYTPSLKAASFNLRGVVPKRFRKGDVDPFGERVISRARRRRRRK